MSHQLQKLHEVQDEKVSLSSDLGDGFARVSTDEEMSEFSCTATCTNASINASIEDGDGDGTIFSDEIGSDKRDEDSDWSCLSCTFRNSLKKRRCGTCNTLRPALCYI
jgi:hypothetical protein